MRRPVTQIDSPGIETVPLPKEPSGIGGRADSWRLPAPRGEEDRLEPNIVRGRD